jgi:hypothetical protein
MVFDFRPARPFAYTFADFARQESRLMTPPSTSQHHKTLGMIFDDKLQWGKTRRTRKNKNNKTA